MEREQFTFYRSYYEALKKLSKRDREQAIMAICAYALDEEIIPLSGPASVMFLLVKPTLDLGRKKAANGKQGGSKRKAKGKQSASEKEGEKEVEGEIENECYSPTPLPMSEKANAVSAVLADYLDRVNPMASQTSLDKLKGYAEEMGEAVCKRAFDIALDNKKASWSYIEAILQDRLRRGVKCLADWDALEEQVKARKEAEKNGRDQRDHQESGNKAYHVGTDL